MSYYVDVHAHLTHDKLSADVEAIVARAQGRRALDYL